MRTCTLYIRNSLHHPSCDGHPIPTTFTCLVWCVVGRQKKTPERGNFTGVYLATFPTTTNIGQVEGGSNFAATGWLEFSVNNTRGNIVPGRETFQPRETSESREAQPEPSLLLHMDRSGSLYITTNGRVTVFHLYCSYHFYIVSLKVDITIDITFS